MKSLSVFVEDVKSSFKSPITLVSVVVLLFVPMLYGGMLLSAFWDPYGKMDQLPVAIVNEDSGAEYSGKALQIGDDLVEELKKSKDFLWDFVSKEEAEQGIHDDKYYMTITIPEDFSAKATTLMDDHPQPAELIYEANEGYNFLASQIGGTAVKEIRSKVSAKVTEAYTESLLEQIEEVSAGFSEASDGAGSIHEGATKLDNGTALLKENLAKLADGTKQLEAGVAPLKDGVGSLSQGTQNLTTGASTLASGLQQLSGAEKQLENGASKVVQGTTQLETGLNSSLKGTAELKSGLQASQQGSSGLYSGMQNAVAGSEQVSEGAKGVAQGLEQLLQSDSELADNPALQQLLAASQSVAAGSEKVYQGQQQLVAGSKSLNEAQTQLLKGAEQLYAGQEQLVQGVTQLHTGQSDLLSGMQQFGVKLSNAATGGQQLANGANELNGGTAKLADGVDELAGGVSTITSGSEQLNDGAGELKDGMSELTEGSNELAEKLGEAAKETGSVQASDDMVSMYAQPIQVQEKKWNAVPNYGTGFTPYFLSLGLFVGAMLATIVLPLKSSVAEASGWNRFVSRTVAFGIIGVVQAIGVASLILFVLGLKVQSVPMFYLLSIVTSLCFIFIMQALATWFDQAGRFMGIILLIFQLTTSAGTFPVELIDGWLQPFNTWLPMTYSVSGFKAVISSGNMSIVWDQVGVLLLFTVPFILATFTYFTLKSRKANNQKDNEKIVIA